MRNDILIYQLEKLDEIWRRVVKLPIKRSVKNVDDGNYIYWYNKHLVEFYLARRYKRYYIRLEYTGPCDIMLNFTIKFNQVDYPLEKQVKNILEVLKKYEFA